MTPEQIDKLKENFEYYYRMFLDYSKLCTEQGSLIQEQSAYIAHLEHQASTPTVVEPDDYQNLLTYKKFAPSVLQDLEEELEEAKKKLAEYECEISTMTALINDRKEVQVTDLLA